MKSTPGRPLQIVPRFLPSGESLSSPGYERYVKWCADRGITPASFDHWKKVNQSISETNYANYWG